MFKNTLINTVHVVVLNVTNKSKGNQLGENPSKRSLEHDAPNQWVGWDRILALYDASKILDETHGTLQYALYFVTLFETGGRVSEALSLRPDQFHWDDVCIFIERMPVLKRRRRFSRNVYIKIQGDPLAPVLIDYVQQCDTRFLLPGYVRGSFSTTIDPDRPACRNHVYNKIVEIDKDIWPHWLRDQRSWQLSATPEKGGCGFDAYLLKAWFEWARMDMTTRYAGRREEKDVMRALGIKERPVRA